MIEQLIHLFADGVFAAIAAIGFSAVSTPPRTAFKYVAIIAAAGHMVRYALMTWMSWNIVGASLVAAIVVGICAVTLAHKARIVPETLAYPSLLPMIPGIYCYKCVQATGLMLSAGSEDAFMHYSYLAAFNGLTALFVIVAMFIGQMLPGMFMRRLVFTSTKGNLPYK